jgi:hypothetical protein
MEVSNLHWVEGGERREIAVDIDGEETIIPMEQKPTLIENGYVFLGADFEDKLPEFKFNEEITLRGFVQDLELALSYVSLMRES